MWNVKFWKRLLGLTVVLTLLLPPAAVSASGMEPVKQEGEAAGQVKEAAEQADENGFLIKDGVLCKYEGTQADVLVPDNVTSIGEHAFSGCTSLISVQLPDGVTSIGEWAFSGCTSLVSVQLPDSVTSIGECAFYNCSGLTSIRLSDKLESIGMAAFQNCKSLTGVEFRTGQVNIGNSAFAECTSLAGIELPEGSSSIGELAFAGCTGLTSLKLAGSSSIGRMAFDGCTELREVVLQSGETSIGAWAFQRCTGLVSISVSLPARLTSIGDGAFARCTGLTEIGLPEGLTSIGDGAFAGCTSLSEIELPEGLTRIGKGAFNVCESLEYIKLPSSVETVGDGAFAFCTNLKQMEITEGNHNFKIYGECLYTDSEEELIYCPAGKEEVNLSENLTNIRDYAFAGCSRLEKVKLPAHVTRIGYQAFQKCCALTGILIPEGVTEIGFYEGFDPVYDSAYIFDTDSEHQGKVTIYGAEYSHAKTYADQYNIPFQSTEEFFRPDQKPLSECQITLSPQSYIYDGTEKRPAVTVKEGEKTLTENTDYIISSYEDNTNVGTARVILDGIGGYTGTATASFTIHPASTGDKPTETPDQKPGETPGQKPSETPGQKPNETPDQKPSETPDQSTAKKSIRKASIKLSKTTYAYSGRTIQPSVKVKVGKTTLKFDRDYTVSYKNNKNVGKATITITGKGRYSGKVTKTFKIITKKGATFYAKGLKYKVINNSQVVFTGTVQPKTSGRVEIPDSIKIGGKTFKVTAVSANALKNMKYIVSVKIGANVTTIGANAFRGCKGLRTIYIRSKKLKSVGKNAFKGIKSTARITVPESKRKAYRKLLKHKGQGSKVRIID